MIWTGLFSYANVTWWPEYLCTIPIQVYESCPIVKWCLQGSSVVFDTIYISGMELSSEPPPGRLTLSLLRELSQIRFITALALEWEHSYISKLLKIICGIFAVLGFQFQFCFCQVLTSTFPLPRWPLPSEKSTIRCQNHVGWSVLHIITYYF